jgi:hypothetical protein
VNTKIELNDCQSYIISITTLEGEPVLSGTCNNLTIDARWTPEVHSPPPGSFTLGRSEITLDIEARALLCEELGNDELSNFITNIMPFASVALKRQQERKREILNAHHP